MGDASVYGGVDVSFGNVSASGDLTATSAANGGAPAIGATPGGSGLSQTKYVDRKWTVTNTGVTFDNYNATFHFAPGDVAGGGNPNNFIAGKKDGGTWSAPTVGTRTATSTQITGATSFSEFSVAEACVPPSIASISAAANPICGDATTTLSAIDVMGDGATVTWWTATGGTGTPVGSGLTSNLVGPGMYYAYVTGDCGTAEASFTVNAKTNVDITGITPTANSICAEQTTTLTANGVVGDGAVVTWYTGPNGTGSNLGTGLSLPGAATGTTYYARVTGDCGAPDELLFALTEAGPVHNVTTNRYYCTIQAAINATSTVANNVIAVTAGTYTENVTVSKAINLRGANFGTAGCASRASESVVAGGAGSAFTITSNGVTIDGFEMTGLYGVSGTGFTKLGIRNNKIAASGAGISVATVVTSSGNTLTIEDNCIDLNTQEVSSNPTIGVFVNGVTGTDAILLDDNTTTDGFYGYLLNGVNTTAPSVVSDGVITGVLQGVAIVNTVGGPLVGSNLTVSGMNMSSFIGASSNPNTNFHSGVYTFTAGATIPSDGITLAINNCTIDGTLTNSPSGAAIYLGDFSAGGVTVQNVTVDECTITDNRNRGIDARGRVNATVTESTFTGNGSAPEGSDGNDGFTMLAQRGATITASNNFITHPVTSTHLVTAFRTGNSPTNSIIATNNKININGNANGRGASTGTGNVTATCNYWGSIVPATNAALMTGSVTYIPWLTDGMDGMLATAGFQPATPCSTPCALVLGSSKNDPTCFGATDGTATVNINSGGVAPYTYLWSNSGNTVSISPLAPGTYTVTVTNANGCTATTSTTIVETPVLNATVNKTDATCFGVSDGTITVTSPMGGYGTYEYSINGGSSWQLTSSYTGLANATYDVRIRDEVNPTCVITLNGALVITQPDVLSASVASTNVTCNGANDGTITITSPTGGYGIYEYSINGGSSWQSSGSYTPLANATYDVRIRDAAHPTCVITLNGTLVITQPNVLSASVASTDVTCNGANDGTITITSPTGGYGTYEYSINGGSSWQSSGSYTPLANATYDVRIRDAAHPACIITLNPALVISQPLAGLAVSSVQNTITCNGGSNGSVNLTVTGGTMNYAFVWSNSATSEDLSGLNAGLYSVIVTDANGCTLSHHVTLAEATPIVLNETNIDVNCFGNSTGSIDLSVSGGGVNLPVAPVGVDGVMGAEWTGASVKVVNYNSAAPTGNFGTPTGENHVVAYEVYTRQDANYLYVACKTNAALGGAVNPSVQFANIYFGGNTSLGFETGTSPTRAFRPGVGSPIAVASLVGGQYEVFTGTNFSGADYIIELAVPIVFLKDDPLGLGITTMNGSAGQSFARISLTQAYGYSVAGGQTTYRTNRLGHYSIPNNIIDGGYSYLWSNSATTQDISGLSANTYIVTVTDDLGCSASTSVVISQLAVLSATVASTDVTCFGASNGTITISSPLGGGGTFEYNIDGGAWEPSGTYTGLPPATYNVQIRDAAVPTCVITLNPALVISEPAAPLTASITSQTNITCGLTSGSVTVAGTGGTMPYSYSTDGLDFSNLSGSFSGLAAGAYTITVRDANLCTVTQPVTILVLPVTNVTDNPDTYYATIQAAINAADPNDVINVCAGTYPENVIVDKRLTIEGAGSTGQTHINGSITFSASGIDASNRSTVKNMSVTNSAGDGVTINNGVSYISTENVASLNNSADGVEIMGGPITNTDLLLKNMRINDNGTSASGTGIRMGGLANVNGLTLMGGEVKRNAQIGFTYNSSVSAIGLTNVLIDGVTFEHNGDDTYASTAQLGTGDISFFSFDGIATLQNVTVIGGPSSNAAHIGVQFRGKNTSTPSGLITINGLNVTGSYKRPTLAGSDPSGPGYGLVFMNYTDVSNVSLNNIDVNCTDGHALFVAGLTTTLNVGDASLTAQNSNSSHIFVGTSTQNNVFTNVNATGATFNGVPASGATSAQYFAIEDKIVHKLDNAALGYVSVKANHDFVTTNSGSLQRGIDAASNGWTVNVNSGTYEEFNINVNKSVTILGANAGVACSGGRGSESIIQNLVNNGLPVINVTADGVTLNGLEIINPWGNSAVDGSGRSNLSIIFNKIHNVGTSRGSGNIYGVRYLVGSATASNVTISDNCISNVANTTMALGNTGGLWFGQSDSPGTLSSLTIERNTISDINAASNKGAWGITIGTGSAAAGSIVAPVIRYNNITAITGGYSSAIDLTGKTPNVVVTNNFVNNINSSGVSPFSAGVTVGAANTGSTSLSINENSFTNVLYGITNANAGTVNGTCNWYGSASGNVVAPKILGNVNYISWLVNGMNDAPSTPGFQPVTLPLPGNCSGTPVFITSAIPSPNQFCQNDGEIEVEFNGGTGTYTVEWTGGTPVSGIAGSPYTISGLTNGNYTITVTDINGTWATIDATVTISPIRRTSVGPVYTYYSTIQDAINAAVAGEVIDICAGTYTETIIINKALTINGPNVGISGTSLLRNEEAVLLNCSIDISNAGNTTLDGLHILRTDVTAGSQIFLDGGGVNTVQNCIFERNDPTIILDPLNSSDPGINMRAISTTTAGGNKNILNNKFTGSLAGGLFSRHRTWNNGIYVDQGPFTVNISGNTLENCRTAINVDDYNINVIIASNTLDNNGTHIAVGGASSTGSYTLGMNTFKTPGSAIINLSNIAESFRLNITSSTYNGVAFNAMTPAQLFDVEARMYHKESYGPASKGKVTYVGGNQYVNNFTVPVTKIDVINNSIKYADAPETINLQEGTYNQKVVVDKSNLTLQGITSDKTLYKINGSGITGPGPLAPLPGSGIVLNNLITGTTIQNLTVENFTGTNGNSHAGIYGINGNNGTTVNNVALLNNISASGFYANGPVDDVEVINSMVNNNGGSARGIVLWNGLKTNINISNNTLSNNRCCGIELSDGNASAVTVVGNTIDVGAGDNAIGLIGLNATVGANLIQGNTITGGGRFGIEIKNPAGGVTVNNNSVTLTTQDIDLRDRAGIAVFRRGVLNGNVDVPNGVTVTNNTVTGYKQTNGTSSSTGFGIVVEGTNHVVNTNMLINNGIAIQLQAGHTPYVANQGSNDALHNGNQTNLADNYFGRGNSPELCNVTTTGNTFSLNTLNGIRVVTGGGLGTIQTDISPITPTVNAVADQLLLCPGTNTAAVTFTGNNLTGVAYNWSNDNTSIGLAASGTGNITSFVVTNTTDVTQIATITVTPVVNGCEGTPENFVISVKPDWDITATAGAGGSISPAGVTTLCSGAGQIYTITPDMGYGILDVLVDGVSNPAAILSGTYEFTNATSHRTIHATFNLLTTISGKIIWEHDDATGVKDATVSVTGAGAGSDDTDVDGNYSVTLVADGNFTITPTKNINRLNGVTAVDAMAVQQHITNAAPITDPYKLIAADVNRSNTVTTADASIINQSILGNPATDAIFNKFWRFVPSTPVLTLPPWGFAESIALTGVSGNQPNNDFIGIKLGDVNGTSNAALRGIPNVALITNDRVLKVGEDIDVVFKVKNFNEIGAYQLAMSFDTDQLQFEQVIASEFIPFSAGNFGTFNISGGELRAVWSRATGFTIPDGSEVFVLRFRSLKDGINLSDVLHIDELNIPAQAYKYTYEAAGIDLVYDVVSAVTEVENKEGLRLLQNRPNPFHEQTTIGFELPVAGEATIKVYNSEGQFITERKGKYPSGYHEEVFSFANGSGILFYELVTDKGILMRKMIQIRR